MAFVGRIVGKLTGRTTSEAVGYGIGGAISPTIEPVLQDLRNFFWSHHPDLPLDPATAAVRAAEAPGEHGRFAAWAKQSGLDADPFTEMVAAQQSASDVGTLLDLRRRGLIDEPALEAGLHKLHLYEPFLSAVKATKHVLLSPADLANARQQEFVDVARQRADSQKQGLEPGDADILFELAGLPPGPMDGLVLLRRGLVDEPTFRRIVAEGHTKTKYTDALLGLRTQILTAAEAAQALLRQHISREQALAIAAQNGYDEQAFEKLFLSAGRPASVGEMQALVNRGLADFATFEKAVAQSDIRDEYARRLFELRRHLPPLFQVARLVQHKAISDTQAITLLTDQGYDHFVAAGIVESGHAAKTSSHKKLAEAQVLELYQGRQVDEAKARELLGLLGYDAGEVDLVLALQDAQRERKFREQAISTVHAAFVRGKLDEAEAQSILDQLQVPPAAKDDLFALWDLERTTVRRELSEAQIVAAMTRGLITHPDALARLQALGYDADDAGLLIATAGAPRPSTRKRPPAA